MEFMDPVQATSPLNMPAEVLATLVELSEEINSSLDLDEVLQKTATLVKRMVDYEIFGVMLLALAAFLLGLMSRGGEPCVLVLRNTGTNSVFVRT